MKYNTLGKTKIKVSEIGFGAEWMGDKTDKHVEKLIKYCQEQKINFLDCWMSDPSIRDKLGNALKNTRKKWIIQGHIGSTWQNQQYTRTRNLKHTKQAFQDLLERLQTEYIDFGMIHYIDNNKDYNKAINGKYMEYIKELKEEKIIHHIGLSTHNPEIGLKATENPEIELLMFSINPAYDMFPINDDLEKYRDIKQYQTIKGGIDPIRDQLYQKCQEKQIPITIMKGYAGGTLLNEKTSPFQTKLTPTQCIHYALTRPAAKSIFVGIHDKKQLNQALKYETATPEEKNYQKTLKNAPTHSYKGQCIYCGHCTPCPENINIPTINKFYDLAKTHEKTPESIQEHYNNLETHASQCTQCKSCMTRCPFEVNIIEFMKNAQKLFGD